MPTLNLNCVFHFSSSHFLTKYRGKCENLHGHNYKLIVAIKGDIKEDGMVMDYAVIKRIVKEKAVEELDHKHLNGIIENPTSENIAIWIWNKLKIDLPLAKIAIYETDNQWVEYEGN